MPLTETLWLAGLALAAFALSSATGIHAVRTLTLALEGHYEFQGDSLTKRSRLAGFTRVFLWAVMVALFWSFFIDWAVLGDLDLAIAAMLVRLEIVLHILAELGDN